MNGNHLGLAYITKTAAQARQWRTIAREDRARGDTRFAAAANAAARVHESALRWLADHWISTTRRNRCTVCDADTARDLGRCTNGCCYACHRRHCSPGGLTSPGHGLNVARARAIHYQEPQP